MDKLIRRIRHRMVSALERTSGGVGLGERGPVARKEQILEEMTSP